MSLIVKGSNFTPAPEGVWDAVCVDVKDKGLVSTPWGEKPKGTVVWEISETMDDGRPFLVSKTYTLSLHTKSQLYKDLRAWRGKDFTPEELEGFDLEKIVNAVCRVVVTHLEKEGSTYANVTAILKADKKRPLKASGDYIRWKDRPENKKNQARPSEEPGDDGDPEYDDNDQLRQDLPF